MMPANNQAKRRAGDDDEGSVSTWTRWALYVHDHPGATFTAELVEGNANNVPDAFHPAARYCEVTIKTPGAADVIERRPIKVTEWDMSLTRHTAYGDKKGDWADVPPERWTEEDWNGNRTACLGRALRAAGYPNTLAELQLVRRWTGAPIVSAATTPATPSATPAGVTVHPTPAASHSAPSVASSGGDPGDDLLAEAWSSIKEAVDAADGPTKAAASRKASDAGIKNLLKPATLAECDTVLAWLRGDTDAAPTDPTPPADMDEEPF